jgi:ribonucleoside-triphosphate reductase
VFLPNVANYDEFVDLLRLLYRVNKHSLALPCANAPETEEVVHRNMRMGIGVTGYLQASDEQKSWLSKAYEDLRDFDRYYSAERGWPISIKLTTCKPSGTLSLLPGVTPGVHPGYAQYMIRRIRMDANHPLVTQCRLHGFNVEYAQGFDGSLDYGTVVVDFPFAYPEGTVLAKDVTAIDQLEFVKELQTNWSDNSVSCTVYYRKEELPAIKEYLAANYNKGHKSLSFLLHSEHGFAQAPYEEITKERYEEMVRASVPITFFSEDLAMSDDADCEGGACPVR